jgi:phosphate-selective porin OprO/OprP
MQYKLHHRIAYVATFAWLLAWLASANGQQFASPAQLPAASSPQQAEGLLLGAPSAFAAPAAERLPQSSALLDPHLTATSHQAAAAPLPPPADDELAELTERLEAAEDELAAMRKESKSAADKLLDLLNKKPAGPDLPLIRLSGFFQVDDGLFSQGPESRAVLGDIKDGIGFRRARLQALGAVSEFTRYSVEVDFAVVGRPSFMDVWGEQSNLPFFGTIRIGHFRQPLSMDGLTSIRHLDFLERNAAFQAMDPFRRTGIMAYRVSDDEMSTLAYSAYATGFTFFNGSEPVYGTIGDTRYGTEIGDSGGISFAIRGTHLLYYDEPAEGRYLFHVGGGYDYSEIGGQGTTGPFAKTYEARAIPEFFQGDAAALGPSAAGTPVVVDSGRILADSFHFAHLETAGNYGAAHFQSEFLGTWLNQMNGDPVFIYGAYLQGGFFLTGESAGYNKQTGVMDYNVKPFSEFFGTGKRGSICGWGAWELAFRWTYLNVTNNGVDPANILVGPPGPPPSPNAGELNESTVALNWWWNQYTRVQFNWIHSMPVYNVGGFAPFDIFGTRFQVEF